MNLQEFINYRQNCPICNEPLITQFHSRKKQIVEYKDGRVIFIFPLKSLDIKLNNYKIGYSFSLVDESLVIEFYHKKGGRYCNHIPNILRNRFLELHQNLGKFRLRRECSNKPCSQYAYHSSVFNIDLRRASFESLNINLECIGLIHTISEEQNIYRIYRMVNRLNEKRTQLFFWKGIPESAALPYITSGDLTQLDLPLIPFVSKQDTIKRLNNLLIFT